MHERFKSESSNSNYENLNIFELIFGGFEACFKC